MKNQSSAKKTLLVIRMSALGDVAMTIPVIYSFAREYPDWQVKVLTQEFFSRLFIDRPVNISFIIASPSGRHRGIIGLFRLINEIRKEGICAVADFHNVLRSWIIDGAMLLSGHSVRMVRKDRRGRRQLTHRKEGEAPVPQRSYILRYFDVLERLGLPAKEHFTSIFPHRQPYRAEEEPVPVIGIAPFARYSTKTYPLEMMEQVVSTLSGRGYNIFLFGSRGHEETVLKGWQDRYSGVTAVAGNFILEEELELMSILDLMISMDSANMHMAALAGTRVLSVWGGTTPECGFLGWGQKEEDAVCLHLPCQPCTIAGSKECPLNHFDCMKKITCESICKRITDLVE